MKQWKTFLVQQRGAKWEGAIFSDKTGGAVRWKGKSYIRGAGDYLKKPFGEGKGG